MEEQARSGSPAPRGEAGPAHAEHAMRSMALAPIAAGVAHDVRNALNALALQVALLGDEFSGAGATAAGEHLAAVREQVRRASEVVRSLADLADPPGPPGVADLGGMAADAAARLQHEARRLGVDLACEAGPGAARARCEAARVARILLGLLWRALAETPAGGRAVVRAATVEGRAVVTVEHTRGPERPELAFVPEAAAAAAAAMGGRLSFGADGGAVRLELRLPGEGLP